MEFMVSDIISLNVFKHRYPVPRNLKTIYRPNYNDWKQNASEVFKPSSEIILLPSLKQNKYTWNIF